MNFNVKKPCRNCPFLKSEKAVRLHPGRAEEIGSMMLSSDGGTFACHKTTDSRERSHCAGALAFALKHDNFTQAMRITQRLRLFKPEEFGTIDQDLIIDEPEEMAES